MTSGKSGLSLVVVRNVPLFADLDEVELERLAGAARRRRAERGEFILRAGESVDFLYILLSGHAKVTNSDEDGREIILALLGPGEFFGEMGLIDENPRSADVVAQEACELLVLGAADFQRCWRQHAAVATRLMQSLVRRLRQADRKIESLALLDVYGRVARLLIEMSEEDRGRRVVKKKLSKQEMARMIGASREMVTKVMRDLEAGAYIAYEGETIVIAGG